MTTSAAKIFVVDDDEALLQTLGWILKDKGYDVVSLPNGDDLLERMEMEFPDLVLLDIHDADGGRSGDTGAGQI